ncbi:MAG: hypothetical protein ACJ740_11280 [Gaiellales bacterium]|jgi:hypothetical protein
MLGKRHGRARRRSTPRVLLVGLTPLMMEVLSGALSERAEVSAVPFPGDAFEQAADDLDAELVLVDTTYLDEALVRPLMLQRFAESGAVLAFVSEQGAAWFDDLGAEVSGQLDPVDAETLIGLIHRPNLTLVE